MNENLKKWSSNHQKEEEEEEEEEKREDWKENHNSNYILWLPPQYHFEHFDTGERGRRNKMISNLTCSSIAVFHGSINTLHMLPDNHFNN